MFDSVLTMLRTRRSVLFTVILVIALFGYLSIDSWSLNEAPTDTVLAEYSLEQMKRFAVKKNLLQDYSSTSDVYTRWNLSFEKLLADSSLRFNMTSSDVIVVLHMQKTAGTSFEKFLVRFLDIPNPCRCSKGRKKCKCTKPHTNQTWLFSRYSTGWLCGLHADFTELYVSGCVDATLDKREVQKRKRRYFYTTFLRDPIARFISEYRHVNRGATWIASRHVCNGRAPTADELPYCYDPQIGWDGVTLEEFLACPFNLAFNRQTRMLADLTLVNCYSRDSMDTEARNHIMLESAKQNLRNFAFFGLKERMSDSQAMFENLFGLRFTRDMSDWSKSKSNDTIVTAAQMDLIRSKNALDIELYRYAAELFDKRMQQMRQTAKTNSMGTSHTDPKWSLEANADSDDYENDSPFQ